MIGNLSVLGRQALKNGLIALLVVGALAVGYFLGVGRSRPVHSEQPAKAVDPVAELKWMTSNVERDANESPAKLYKGKDSLWYKREYRISITGLEVDKPDTADPPLFAKLDFACTVKVVAALSKEEAESASLPKVPVSLKCISRFSYQDGKWTHLPQDKIFDAFHGKWGDGKPWPCFNGFDTF